MPASMMPAPSAGSAAIAGSGNEANRASSRLARARLRISTPSTVTNDGQKPSVQLVSLLQLDWLMRRLRPSSVSDGSLETQPDFTEQSPQPQQTGSWQTTPTLRS